MKTKIYKKLEHYVESEFTTQTAATYLGRINKFLSRYPAPEKLSLGKIESYFNELRIKGDSRGYRNVTLCAVKALYTFLEDENLIDHHPCKSMYISGRKAKGKNFEALLTIEEMEELFNLKKTRYNNLKNRDKVIIGLLIYQGMTSDELVNLRVKDIDLDKGFVRIVGSGHNRTRTIELKQNQILPLERYINRERPKISKTSNDVLILTLKGLPLSVNGLGRFFRKLRLAIGKEVSPSNIRQSVISYWLNDKKIPLEDVQIMAGHRYPSSTEAYIREDVIEKREAVNMLHSKMFG